MAQVYSFLVDDAPYPAEMEFARAIKLLGVKAVTGLDVLSTREIRDCMMSEYAEKIIQAYRAREASPNWSEWAEANPKQNEMLEKVHELWQIQSR